jgi:hypothetical protein
MAGIGTADVTYTVKNFRRLGNSKVHNRVQLAFGDGAKTYSAGGVPLVIGSLGCPNVVESLTVVEQSTAGYMFSFISSTNKLAIFQSPSHTHALYVASGAGTTGTLALAAGGTLAQGVFQSGAGLSVAGIAAASGTIGGIVNVAAGSLTETTSVALAAQTIVCEVIGW